ncbi:MAG: BON domain-containing protein [Alphaproteobacteria bacterium]|nr:BON domain-containing protein [Alphaproteobacteria bacterium]
MKKQSYTTLLATVMILSSCAPVIIGGGAMVGGLATREKGVTGTMTDSQISVTLKARLYSHNQDLHAKVGINVQNAEVLLTGSVPEQQWQVDAERIAWDVKGVKHVINNIEVSNGAGFGSIVGSISQDAWITTQIKSKLTFAENVNSLNYSVKTVGSVVYIMGIAQNQDELNRVTTIISNISGVKKVVSYAHLRDEA